MEPSPPPPTPAAAPLPWNVKVLGLASLINDTASEMIYPLLPAFLIGVLGGSKAMLGMIEGVADTVASLLKLWSGGRSDLAGRRQGFVLFGYGMAAVTRPLIGLALAPWHLLAIRIGDRIGKGVRSAPRDALIADSADPSIRGRAFGFDRAMDHIGAAVGPLLAAGFLLAWPEGLRTLFLLSVVPGLLVVGLVLFGLREVPATEPARNKLHLTLAPFGGSFRLYLLALVVFTFANSSDAFLLVRAKELGVAEALLPLLWCAFHIVKSFSNLYLGRAVDRFGARPLIFLGWIIYAGIYLAFAFASTAVEVWAFFLGYAFFFGLTEPATPTLVTELVGSERKGLAFGWYNFAIGIATLPSNLIFGWLYEAHGALAAFGWGAGMAVVAVGILVGVKKPASVEV